MPGVEKPENESEAALSEERRQADDVSGPHTDRNPGTAVPEVSVAPSGARPTSSTPPPASSDTLLSLPTPASREDLAFDERMSMCERRIDDLVRRVEALEQRRGNTGETPERGRWIWLLFLVALAIVWQIVSLLR